MCMFNNIWSGKCPYNTANICSASNMDDCPISKEEMQKAVDDAIRAINNTMQANKINEAIECIKSNYPTSSYTQLKESLDLAIKIMEEKLEGI